MELIANRCHRIFVGSLKFWTDETYSNVHTGKYLSDVFRVQSDLKQRSALKPLRGIIVDGIDTTLEVTLQGALFAVRHEARPRRELGRLEDGGDMFLRNVNSY
jgi:hypothetical protein